MEIDIIVPFIAAFVAGIIGSEVGCLHKGIQRAPLVRAALGTLIGFMSAIVTLLLMSRDAFHPLVIAVPVGCLFGYLMADAEAFRRLK